jgi:chorismate mutase
MDSESGQEVVGLAATQPTTIATADVAATATMTVEELRNQIDVLDEEIVRLWRRRAAISHQIGMRRIAAGGTRIVLSREYEVISRYRAALGSEGAELALLALRTGRGTMAASRK